MHHLNRRARTLGTGLAIALTIAASLLGAGIASAHSNITGYVYVNDNTAGANTIAGFAQHANGTLTPLAGSPFPAGGAGAGATTPSQGAIQRSSDGRYLLAVDAGSNQISVLRIHDNGSLTTVGSPTSSHGVEPVSLAVSGDLVYVANNGSTTAQPNYTGFWLDAHGHLSAIAGSTVWLPIGSQPGDILFNGAGNRLVGVRVNTSLIDSFTVGGNGTLTAAPGSPISAQAAGPFGSAFRPGHPSQLFVSNAHAGANNGTISAFHDGHLGVLTSIGASPFADKQTAPCWVDISPDGQYLFAVNTASSSISRFKIADGGKLTLLGSTALNDGSGLSPFDIRVSPDGDFAYVVDAGRDAVSALKVHNGSLTELSSSPIALPTGAFPFGVVVIDR
jgi:6-phosphogluconolactonase